MESFIGNKICSDGFVLKLLKVGIYTFWFINDLSCPFEHNNREILKQELDPLPLGHLQNTTTERDTYTRDWSSLVFKFKYSLVSYELKSNLAQLLKKNLGALFDFSAEFRHTPEPLTCFFRICGDMVTIGVKIVKHLYSTPQALSGIKFKKLDRPPDILIQKVAFDQKTRECLSGSLIPRLIANSRTSSRIIITLLLDEYHL